MDTMTRTPAQQRAYDHGFGMRATLKQADPKWLAATIEDDTRLLGPALAEHYLAGWSDRENRDSLQWALERNEQLGRIEAVWGDWW